MKFGGPSAMRIPSGDDAAAAGTAGTCSKKCIGKGGSFAGQPVDIGRFDDPVSVTPYIVPANIVGNDEHEIRFILRKGGERAYKEASQAQAFEKVVKMVHGARKLKD